MTEDERISLREYIEAILEEQRKARVLAAEEREKAAIALRRELARAIQEGDDRLHEHIANQIRQIDAALVSAEALEISRVDAVTASLDGLRREAELTGAASKEAILKAEDSQREVNAKSSEFRGQLSDQAANLMPRREAESKSAELDRRIQLLERGDSGRTALSRGVKDLTATWLAAVALLIALAAAILPNIH